MTRDELKSILTKPYNRTDWQKIARNVFPNASFLEQPCQIPCDDKHVEQFLQVGNVRLNDGKNLAIFEIQVSSKTDIQKNRVTLRELIAKYIDQQTNHGVLVIFNSEKGNYRYTFAARESEINEEGALVEHETAPKRFTYVLGPGEPCKTATDRFFELSQKKETATLPDVIDAFSVERLTKEFFQKYKEHYQKMVQYLLTSQYRKTVFNIPDNAESQLVEQQEKTIRDFVKKLLGRLVFIQFLQKKGWLGCPPQREDWSGGDKDFTGNLFKNCSNPETFHSKVLIPLFHEALNRKGRDAGIFAITGTRVPYLNGGLFEEDIACARNIDFPSEYFQQLIEFFAQYNFTIDENDPEDHEVGIDPEMLGHIFENLLEDNKDKGAYYTPKSIVQYMCRQSLIEYLKTSLGDHKEIEDLVHLKTRGNEKDKNNFILKNAEVIEKLLDEIKICDPAIGSGAFPIGLLQEIYWIKLTLDWTLDRAEVKRKIIQNSIYGVDLDAGAVEIARLRFWLALIVDEEKPRPLPNLDYKIMQGNSLLESFECIRLDRILQPETVSIQELGTPQISMNLGVTNNLHFEINEEQRQNILNLTNRYFTETDPEKKADLHKEIDKVVLSHIDYNIGKQKEIIETQLNHFQTSIDDKQKLAKQYKPSKKEQARLDELEVQLKISEQQKNQLHEFRNKPERPFFLWHLFFQDVFEKGGFDIVIANPPYVRQESIKELKPLLENEGFDCFTGTADLFVYFYEKAVKLLKKKGILTFITSNKYYRSGYGKKLRKYLAENLRIKQMIDFGDAPVFEAIAYASIIIAQKDENVAGNKIKAYSWDREDHPAKLLPIMRERSFDLEQVSLKPDYWGLESNEVMRLLEKIRNAGTPLKEYVEGRFYRGILTGLNEAFVVDRMTRDRLIEEDPKSGEVLKPFLRGKDVKRWNIEYNDLWVIFTRHGTDIDKYPAIEEYLSKFKNRLIPGVKGGRKPGSYKWFEIQDNIAYWKEFENKKIVWGNLAKEPQFSFCNPGIYINAPANMIVSDSNYLLALLNSTLTHYV
ncbi:MAG: N-6 DNA methylase, partial [Fibrobacter sp.]|nr:N-6 DNA methylase [Fibrobacter sp.]